MLLKGFFMYVESVKKLYMAAPKNILKYGLCIGLLVVAYACQNTGRPIPQAAEDVAVDTTQQCFIRIHSQDTVYLRLFIKGEQVWGRVEFTGRAMEPVPGVFKGLKRDKGIIGLYTFSDSGRQRVQEVAFRLQDSLLLEGEGPKRDHQDTVLYQNYPNLNYSRQNAFRQMSCNTFR